jgi:hypothetical protein
VCTHDFCDRLRILVVERRLLWPSVSVLPARTRGSVFHRVRKRLEVNPAELDIELVTRAGPIESAGADGLFFACLTRPSCCRVMR